MAPQPIPDADLAKWHAFLGTQQPGERCRMSNGVALSIIERLLTAEARDDAPAEQVAA